jgi:hypothetical protein
LRKGTSRELSSSNTNARRRGRQKDRQRDFRKALLALSRLEALLSLVDDVDAAFAANEAVVAMTIAQGFERITDFHDITEG